MRPPLAEALPALAEAARTVGGPQIRNRGTIGGNLGTASPAGDALPPLLVADARGPARERARGADACRWRSSSLGPKRNALAGDELIAGVTVEPAGRGQTFMKVGPRNAMVIAVVSLALSRRELRAAFGSAGPVPALVRGALDEAGEFADRVADGRQPDRRRARDGPLPASCAACPDARARWRCLAA